ncbi:DNA-binding protein [Devosia riboflavina]|uniref:DNA-binding protein n=1 Tax=Devosia riboflavina TaxID=46914 RepID=A0A087LXY6_9HYPH|nr:DNA-binding protein [Devosia riboflavina]KFL29489.1 DNA-binding protein [Devosia riboflavina]
MAAFDFDAAVRWGRLDPGRTLSRRDDAELPFIGDHPGAGHGLLLDTCVYIDGLQGRAPDAVDELLNVRTANHSTVAIQELMHTVGVLDPADPRTKSAVKQIGVLVDAMPAHRTFAPDVEVLARAAMLSGILCRLQGHDKDARLRALHDCILFLQAQKLGFAMLTGNIADFDYLLQLVPAARVLFYRRP